MAPCTATLKLFLLLALIATSCMAQQSPAGAPLVSPAATPTVPPPSPAVPSPSPSSPKAASPAPESNPVSPSPSAPASTADPGPEDGPAADHTPGGGSNHGFVSKAAVGGTFVAVALVAAALI